MRIPISTKIITLTVTILVGATALIAKQSSEYFKEKMTFTVDEANSAEAAARAKEVDNILNSALERSYIIATLLLKQSQAQTPVARSTESTNTNRVQNLDEVSFNFNKDKTLVAIEVLQISASGNKVLSRKVKDDYFKQFKSDAGFLNEVRQKAGFPIASVAQKKFEILNTTLPGGPPLVTIGFPIAHDESGRVTHIALADLQMGLVQKPFANLSERIFYLIDKNGFLLAHQSEDKAIARQDMRTSPLVAKALKDSHPRWQTKFEDPDNSKTYIGAYVKNPTWGTTVIAQTAEEIILEPAKEVQRKAYYISGIVISIALFLCFLFSMTLTSPIEKLAEMIKLVSKGDFDVKARAVVRSHDEVGDLAKAFDKMTEGLKERDKVKSLFSKFHGSSITDDLLKKDIGLGGSKKDVTVFFSDIRGFTKFSEGHTPEEVVTMLNEYFGVMVGLINKYGGVVDKFIGDAIMAVWGAPQSSDKDTHNAVRASLEMRRALQELNQLRERRGQTPIMIGIGLHCGPAISGTIGSNERLEYTVIGDTVNMTSRIEASTKAFGADLLVSDAIFAKVGEEFLMELAGSAEVKGKSEPLKMYKVRGYRDSAGGIVEIRTPFSDYEPEHADKVKVAS